MTRDDRPDRRTFLVRAAAGCALAAPALLGGCATGAGGAPGASSGAPDRPPPLPRDLVLEFVRAGHGDLERTRALLAETPALLNATWDWGGGDFETALGGASHVGSREVAELLLGEGARIDLFCAAMLDMLPVVSAVVDRHPDAVGWAGPHGISLMRHARAGEARRVIEYLGNMGAS